MTNSEMNVAPENHKLIQTVMNKLDALETKIAMKNTMKTNSNLTSNTKIGSKIDSNAVITKTKSMPTYTYTDYVNERAKLDELIRMRKSL